MNRSAYVAAGILFLYGLLTLGYLVQNPLFEAPDENHHYYTALSIAVEGKLPIAADNLARQEAAQPPLYYLLLSLFIDESERPASLQINPYAQLGQTTGNPNLYVHEPGWQADETAVIRLRLFSVIFGGITLIAIYQAGRTLWPNQPASALLAMSLVAFLPQFNFLHASISNDTLIICLCSLAIWQVIRFWLSGVTNAHFLYLGLTLGLALLTKTAGLLLLLWVIGAFGWWLWRTGAHGRLPLIRNFILLTLLPALLLSGWLFWRNWTLYGDITAANKFIELAGGERPLTISELISQLGTVAQSAIARFGWMTVKPPSFIYWLWAGIIMMALLGILTAVRQYKNFRWDLILCMASWVILLTVGWLQFMLKTPADQGRLLFPALLPIALALAFGLTQFRFYWLAGVTALATACFTILVVLPSAYAPPPFLDAADIPASANMIGAQFSTLELVAVDHLPATAVAGEPIQFVLYWKKTDEISHPPTAVIKLFGHQLETVSSLHTYHGNGLFPANYWPTGKIIEDIVTLTPTSDANLPTEARLFASILDDDHNQEIGQLKIIPATWPAANNSELAQIGEGISLTNARVITSANEIQVHLQWHIRQTPNQRVTTFVHLGDPAQSPIVQADGPPRGGFYPTSLWAAGEVFSDTYTIPLPADLDNGRYPLHIGLYDSETGTRLPLFINGQRQPNDAYWLGEFATTR